MYYGKLSKKSDESESVNFSNHTISEHFSENRKSSTVNSKEKYVVKKKNSSMPKDSDKSKQSSSNPIQSSSGKHHILQSIARSGDKKDSGDVIDNLIEENQ